MKVFSANLKREPKLTFLTFFVPILSLIMVGASFLFSARTYYINISEKGFATSSLTISAGSTVVWKNTGETLHWPASDFHPTHSLYPGGGGCIGSKLDACRGLKPGQTFAFKFDQVGVWGMHDHLFPGATMVVHVTSFFKKDVTPQVASANVCSQVADKNRCWGVLIEQTLKTKGLAASFNLVEGLYSTDPNFAANCHGFMHQLGAEAYTLYNEHKEVTVATQASMCGYGFYHAFMQALLYKTGDLSQARDFCDYLGSKLQDQDKFARLSCFHGIGHGLMPEYPDPGAKGDPQAMVASPLKQCGQISTTSEENYQCANGIYNVIAIYLNSRLDGLQPNLNDPFSVCPLVNNLDYKRACYDQMNTLVYSLTNGNFSQALNFVIKVSDSDSAQSAMHGVASVFGMNSLNTGNANDLLENCRSVSGNLYATCYSAFLAGMVEGGTPGKEYTQAFAACNGLTRTEQDGCKGTLYTILTNLYSPEKLQTICAVKAYFEQDYCKVNS